jgi:transposase
VRWQNRRFFCSNPHCGRRIFTARLPQVAASHARKTNRLTIILRAVAFACGGEEGARLLERLAIPASADTLLREIRRIPDDNCPTVRVVGVDDWALRRGQRYGTILVDLERHCPVELLPERSAEAFAAWLRTHPEVEVISRDRGDCYIKGAGIGAPQAMQVTDRWHLLHNLQEALVQLVDRHRKQLKDVAKSMREPETPYRIPIAPRKNNSRLRTAWMIHRRTRISTQEPKRNFPFWHSAIAEFPRLTAIICNALQFVRAHPRIE